MDNGILRKNALILRKKMFLDGKIDHCSFKIVSKIQNLPEFKSAKNIALYYPLDGEINLLALLEYKDKKNFYFPRCSGLELEFVKYASLDDFKKGKFSIMEPVGVCIGQDTLAALDLIFVPCLLANKSCHRLGHGAGYYDRFFNKNKLCAKKIIVCPKCFVTDDFSVFEHDAKCDLLISDD